MKLIAASLCLATACFSEDLGFTSGQEPGFEVPAMLPTPLDVLVVVDDTTAMAAHVPRVPDPANLAGVLDAIYNGFPNVRIAVTTTTSGTLRTSAEVPSGVVVHTRSFMTGAMETNYPGTLASALGSLMNIGATSTAANEVLASTERALDCDFLRPDSSVGILMVSASDDESPQDVGSYAGAIQANGHPVLVSAVFDTAPRLAQFVDAFGDRYYRSFETYSMESIVVFAQLFAPRPGNSCLPLMPDQYEPWDADASLHCEMAMVYAGMQRSLPRCDGSAWDAESPCYQVIRDVTCSSGRALLLGGGYHTYHPRIIGGCVAR